MNKYTHIYIYIHVYIAHTTSNQQISEVEKMQRRDASAVDHVRQTDGLSGPSHVQ